MQQGPKQRNDRTAVHRREPIAESKMPKSHDGLLFERHEPSAPAATPSLLLNNDNPGKNPAHYLRPLPTRTVDPASADNDGYVPVSEGRLDSLLWLPSHSRKRRSRRSSYPGSPDKRIGGSSRLSSHLQAACADDPIQRLQSVRIGRSRAGVVVVVSIKILQSYSAFVESALGSAK